MNRRIDSVLLSCVDAGLAAVLFVVPFILGGRIALGQLVLVTLALWTAVCWCLRQSLDNRATWIRTPAGPILMVALALVAVQIVPLRPAMLEVLSPHIHDVLPLWTANADSSPALGPWTTLSLTPASTRNCFILLLAFALLFLTTVQRVRRVEDVERLLRWVALSTLAMAAFALVQYFTRNGKYFWFYEHPFASTQWNVVGGFTNRNHFAQFIALGIGPLIWWLQTELRRFNKTSEPRGLSPRQTSPQDKPGGSPAIGLLAVGLGVAVFAALMSLSRGGAMAVTVAAVVCLAVLHRGSLVGRKTLLAVAGAGLLAGAFLHVYGYELVSQRLDDFGSIKELDNGGRSRLWRADAGVIADYPIAGTGLGSHREICPTYLHDVATANGLEYTHAENGYVQVALESGVPGLLLVLAAIGLCAYWCVASLRSGPPRRVLLCFAAIAAGLAANFVHSMVDFVWYVPGCMVVVVVLAACACRLWQLTCCGQDEHDESVWLFWVPRGGWLAAAAVLVLIGAFMVQNRFAAAYAEPFWHRYLALSDDVPEPDEDEAGRAEKLQDLEKSLAAVVRWEPDHARAHARLAAVHLALFDCQEHTGVVPITVKQLSNTVACDGRLQLPGAAGAWLSKAFPQRRRHLDAALRHAYRSVTLCPLLGENYIFLGNLSFLAGPNLPARSVWVDQALRVRPFDGAVLFAAGQEAALAGNFNEAVRLWQASARAGPKHQNRLLKLLISRLPVAVVLDIVQPDLPGLRWLRRCCRELGRTEELPIVEERCAKAAEDKAGALHGKSATARWLEAASAYQRLDRLDESLRCLRRAVGGDMSDFDARCALGTLLLKLKEFDEAERHLGWCLQQKPRNQRLRRQMEAAVDGRLRVTSLPPLGG